MYGLDRSQERHISHAVIVFIFSIKGSHQTPKVTVFLLHFHAKKTEKNKKKQISDNDYAPMLTVK